MEHQEKYDAYQEAIWNARSGDHSEKSQKQRDEEKRQASIAYWSAVRGYARGND